MQRTLSPSQKLTAALETLALVQALANTRKVDISEISLIRELPANPNQAVGIIDNQLGLLFARFQNELNSRAQRTALEIQTLRFNSLLGKEFAYEFSEGDLNRVQSLINELRAQVQAANFLSAEHRARLLKRVERVQQELHKRVSDLDRFWGLVGDAGVALRKFGEDAKPIVDRVRELAELTWRTQARSEGLTSDAAPPMLLGPRSGSSVESKNE